MEEEIKRWTARQYLGEAMYRFNRRFCLAEMLPRLTRAVAVCKPCPETFLRAATNFTY